MHVTTYLLRSLSKILVCLTLAACGASARIGVDAFAELESKHDSGADVTEVADQSDWLVLDLSQYKDGDISPLIASHQTAVVFPLDLSTPHKVVWQSSPAQLLEVQTKTPCGVSPNDNLVGAMERDIVAADIPAGDATNVDEVVIRMPYASTPDDGFRRGPGRVCFGTRSGGRWEWHMSFVDPDRDDDLKLGVARLPVARASVDAIALLFHETSHVRSIGVKITPEAPLRRWALPPGRLLKGELAAASAGAHGVVAFVEEDEAAGATPEPAVLKVQDLSSEGLRVGPLISHVVPLGGADNAVHATPSIASDGSRFVICLAAVGGVMCFLHLPGGAKLQPILQAKGAAERVAVARAPSGWIVGWSTPRVDGTGADLVLRRLGDDFVVAAGATFEGLVSGEAHLRSFWLTTFDKGVVVASGDPVVVRWLDSGLTSQRRSVATELPLWFYGALEAHRGDVFLSASKPYGGNFLHIRDHVLVDVWALDGVASKDGLHVSLLRGPRRIDAIWRQRRISPNDRGDYAVHVQSLAPSRQAPSVAPMRDDLHGSWATGEVFVDVGEQRLSVTSDLRSVGVGLVALP